MINIEEIYYLEKTKEVFERDRILRILPGEDNLYANIKKVDSKRQRKKGGFYEYGITHFE